MLKMKLSYAKVAIFGWLLAFLRLCYMYDLGGDFEALCILLVV